MKGSCRAEIPLKAVEDPMEEQVAGPRKGCDSVVEPTLEQSTEDCSAWKGLELEKNHGGLTCMRGTPRWHRGRV